jgi:hypothetical protein
MFFRMGKLDLVCTGSWHKGGRWDLWDLVVDIDIILGSIPI